MSSLGIFAPLTFTCPQCRNDWEGIELWRGMTLKCGPCQKSEHNARLATYNADRSFTVEEIGGACPTQATGRTATGRPYYFRARHGDWTLSLGDYGDEDGVMGEEIAAGDDPTGGDMPDADVLSLLDEHLPDP